MTNQKIDGVENDGYSYSGDEQDGNVKGQNGIPQNGSALSHKDEITPMVSEMEEAKIEMLPKEMQQKLRTKPAQVRAIILDPLLMKRFTTWSVDRNMKVLDIPLDKLERLRNMSEGDQEEYLTDLELDEALENDAKNAQASGNAQQSMMQKLQHLPPEMRQIFMSMSDEERQKFLETLKKAADWPPDKKQKMFKKIYQDHMKKQVQDIMKARRKERKNMKTVGFFELFRYADGLDKLLMIIGTIGAIITGCGLPINVLFYGQVANEFISSELAENNDSSHANNVYEEVMSVVPYFVINGVVVLISAFTGMTCWSITAERQGKRIRSLLFHNIMKQHIGWFDMHQSGELNVRLSDDIMKIQMGMGDKVFTLIQWMTSFVAGYTVGFVQGWLLTLVILAVAPIMVVAVAMVAVVTQRFTIFEQLAYARAGGIAEEVLSSIRTVAAFGGEEKECHRYNSRLDGAKQVGIRRGFFAGFGSGFVWLVIFGAYALAFWYGTQLVINEGYEPGDILQVFMGVLIGTTSLGQCLPNMEYISGARGAAASVYDIMDLESEIDSTSEEGSKPEIVGNVRFEDVHFTYPARKDVKVLNGLSLEVKVGSTVALVGPSGCGKSTTVQLLQRFYDPQYGKICVDGHDIREMNVAWLRRNVGVVSQEPVLFATNIAENIRYGQEGVTKEEIETAARNANAYDFINKLPQKFNTLVGERGAQLSGGQKQRIAIARALVRNPKILLLDEATSALDTESESIVQQALERASKGRTTIVIAHRLSTIKNADVIVGIFDGKNQEMGSHEELMEKEGIYYHLVMSQTAAEHSEENFFLDVTDDELDSPKAIERTVSFDEESLRRSFRRSLRKQSKYREQSSVVSRASSEMSEDEEEGHQPPPFRRLLRMNSPESKYITVGCTAAMFTGALQPCFAIIFAEIMGNFAEPDPEKMESNSELYALLLVLLGVAVGVANLVMGYSMANAGEKLTLRLRQMTFAAMLRQEMGWFDDKKNQVGALTSRLATDASLVRQATGQQLATIIQSFCTMIASLLIAFIFGWKLAFVVVAFLPLIVFSTMFQKRMAKDAMKGSRMAVEGGGKISAEAIDNIRTVAALNREETFERTFNSYFSDAYKKSIRKAFVFGGSYSISASVTFFCYAAAFSYGAKLVQDGEMEFTNVFRIFAAVTFGGQALGRASSLAPDLARAKTAAANIFKLLDRKPSIDPSSKEGSRPERFSGEVKFEGVEFRYPSRPDVKVLQGLDLGVKPGQTLALVGSSGCGKSTTIQLIERFYNVAGGFLYFDRYDQSKLNVQWLRSQLGLVQQEPVLFDTSIRENIAYGDNSRVVPMNEIITAARSANIHNFIDSLPQGYETNVGDKGTQLSGGQKQRIAIARALVRNPKVLLLDEATSALDTESERIVQEALDKAREGRTCIVIAHRLSTIINADNICVIHNGQIVEIGSHHHLMELKGYYYRLQQAQVRGKHS